MTKAKALSAPAGIARGLNKGHVVTKRKAKLNKKTKQPLVTPSRRKGVRQSLRCS